jgi:hypothetical protein
MQSFTWKQVDFRARDDYAVAIYAGSLGAPRPAGELDFGAKDIFQ